jgi:glycosyltransferase involved in cell wall biosynthesis
MKSMKSNMKHELFLSVVVVTGQGIAADTVARMLTAAMKSAEAQFTDFEVIVVDNGSLTAFTDLDLHEDIRRNCYIVDLARPTSVDAATLAGLERANGDYVCVFDHSLAYDPHLLERMVESGIGFYDITYLRDRKGRNHFRIGRQLFFAALRAGAGKAPHSRDRREMLLSRRALNWIVRHRSTQSGFYLNDTVLSSGFTSHAIEVDVPVRRKRHQPKEASGAAWATLVRSESFLLFATRLVVVSQVLLSVIALTNALLVRFAGYDIFGTVQTSEPGWAYVVVLVTLGFTAMSALLFIIVRIQFVSLALQRQDPSYIVRSFSRM